MSISRLFTIDFKDGDIIKNKHTREVVRVVCVFYHYKDKNYKNVLDANAYLVTPSGYGCIGDCSSKHWRKLTSYRSLFWWYKVSLIYIIKEFCIRYHYKTSKHLGMVDPISAGDYWKTHNHYKEEWKPIQLYGYLNLTLRTKVVDLPYWREVNFNPNFEYPLHKWFFERLKALFMNKLYKDRSK